MHCGTKVYSEERQEYVIISWCAWLIDASAISGKPISCLNTFEIGKHTLQPSSSLANDRHIAREHARACPDGLKELLVLQKGLKISC
jgi:hypothetical protein